MTLAQSLPLENGGSELPLGWERVCGLMPVGLQADGSPPPGMEVRVGSPESGLCGGPEARGGWRPLGESRGLPRGALPRRPVQEGRAGCQRRRKGAGLSGQALDQGLRAPFRNLNGQSGLQGRDESSPSPGAPQKRSIATSPEGARGVPGDSTGALEGLKPDLHPPGGPQPDIPQCPAPPGGDTAEHRAGSCQGPRAGPGQSPKPPHTLPFPAPPPRPARAQDRQQSTGGGYGHNLFHIMQKPRPPARGAPKGYTESHGCPRPPLVTERRLAGGAAPRSPRPGGSSSSSGGRGLGPRTDPEPRLSPRPGPRGDWRGASRRLSFEGGPVRPATSPAAEDPDGRRAGERERPPRPSGA
ncbi:proline-rich protein 2-like [Gracilinanus agilis]|uniref:proline-rich protein 2-like n=1 Tax=Gracilinanus agilis TaxID=191870 RepID=UPI001CFDDD10|nr:proline-rich protein 2-like [Gracilinanus agilis]